MNKYKIVSLLLGFALLATLVRLVYVIQGETAVQAVASKQATVFENILNRKSVRSYTDRAVSREQIDTLLRAAMAAPTGRDMRPWKFVVVDDKETLAALAEQLPHHKMLPEAAVAIVVCGDLSVVDDKGEASRNWTFDCSAATENLLLMAEAMGLGAVWTGIHPYDERVTAVRSALELPEEIIPLNLIPIGYPKGDPQPKDKYNADNVHFNGW